MNIGSMFYNGKFRTGKTDKKHTANYRFSHFNTLSGMFPIDILHR